MYLHICLISKAYILVSVIFVPIRGSDKFINEYWMILRDNAKKPSCKLESKNCFLLEKNWNKIRLLLF